MQFDSFTFLMFFTCVIALYQLAPSWKSQKIILLVASYLFYAAWSPPLIVLIWISTLADFYISQLIYKTQIKHRKKQLLFLSLAINLGLLSYFKYAEFLLDSFVKFINIFGIGYVPPEFDIILPIGISFYTFQTLSYTIDVYRKKQKPTKNILDFSLYVTFFPQLVAGPIVRASQFLPQCVSRKKLSMDSFVLGMTLVIWGVFQKTVLADSLFSPIVDQFYTESVNLSLVENWLAIFSFSMQIYFDFSGYSLCAVGTAMILGFSLPDNFNAPYAALGVSDFWKRWHITLSEWLRDYLYIPLGGSRNKNIKTLRNLSIVMFLGGLWHGASWNFIIWGLIHGVFLITEHQIRRYNKTEMPEIFIMISTFLLVSLAWIPFRSPDLDTSLTAFLSLFDSGINFIGIISNQQITAIFVISLLLIYQYWRRHKTLDQLINNVPPGFQAVLIAFSMTLIALNATGDSHAFIYFQF